MSNYLWGEMTCMRCDDVGRYPDMSPVRFELGGGVFCSRCHAKWNDARADIPEVLDYEHALGLRDSAIRRGTLRKRHSEAVLARERALRERFMSWIKE